jgi:predicted TIM-barrel fold metal-dependent hydrolase
VTGKPSVTTPLLQVGRKYWLRGAIQGCVECRNGAWPSRSCRGNCFRGFACSISVAHRLSPAFAKPLGGPTGIFTQAIHGNRSDFSVGCSGSPTSALVLSLAHQYGNPNKAPVADEYEQVRRENDWTANQVAKYPDRLRAFCGVDPLKPYAISEIERCAKNPYLHYGLKVHFGNSDVDMDNPRHVARLRHVFRTADKRGMAIVVHMRPSVTRNRPYGAKEAKTFLDKVLPSAPHVPIQIAHLAGAGGFDDPSVNSALSVFIDAIAKQDARMANVYFDICGVAGIGRWKEKKVLIARRIRQIGISRMLWGSDGAFGGGMTPAQALQAY